jgi:Flp pilus assembly protein TadD
LRARALRRRSPRGAPLSRRLLLLALALVAYLGALGAPFVFDDAYTVVDNPSIRHLSNLRWIFIGSRRSLTNFSYAVDWALWGPRPFGFHLTNLILHALVVLALFELARRLWQNDAPAFFAAALFAVHPLLSESVAYVSSRAGLLCALFLVTGTWAWHRGLTERRRWLVLAGVCWILAAASKETGLLLPVLWVACDVLFTSDWRRRLLWYLPFAAVAFVAGLWRVRSYLNLEGGATHDLGLRLLAQTTVFWRYVFLWILPIGQSLVHPVAPGAPWLSLAGLAVVVALLFTLPRPALFGGLWFLLLLLPSSLMPLMHQMAEHRLYEAAAGAALLSAALLYLRPKLAAVALAALAVATILRVQLWRDPVRLWQDAVNKAPGEWLAHYALGDALRDRGECGRALDEYAAAMAIQPNDARAPRNRAICLALLARYDEAEGEMRRLLEISPRDATLYYNLGQLEFQRSRSDAARARWLRAVELGHPRACEALARLGELPPVCRGQIH